MGINILNIEKIVNWNLPIRYNVYDLYQRLNRGGRDLDRRN